MGHLYNIKKDVFQNRQKHSKKPNKIPKTHNIALKLVRMRKSRHFTTKAIINLYIYFHDLSLIHILSNSSSIVWIVPKSVT